MANFSHSDTHFNGNLFCAIDLETTGLSFMRHDIIQICVMPITPNLQPSKEINFFHCLIKPRRPENIDDDANKVNRGKVVEAITHGLESETAEERLREWFKKLPLPINKLIVPLGHNYSAFDRDFLVDWLGGPLSYGEFFRSDHRDTMSMALMLNDQAAHYLEQIPFPKVGLKFLAGRLGMVNEGNAHDAVGDCVTTIEVYKRLMRYKDFCVF